MDSRHVLSFDSSNEYIHIMNRWSQAGGKDLTGTQCYPGRFAMQVSRNRLLGFASGLTDSLSLSICPPCFFTHACTSFTRDGSCYLYYIDLNLLLYYLGSRSYRRPLAVAAELQQRAAGRGGGYLRRCWLFLGWWLWSWGCDWCSYAGVVGHLCNGCKEFGIWSSYYIIT